MGCEVPTKSKTSPWPRPQAPPSPRRAGTPPTNPAPRRSSPQVPVKSPRSCRLAVLLAGSPPALDFLGDLARECVTFPSSGAVRPSPSLQPPGKRAGPGREALGPSGFAWPVPPGPGRWKCSVGFRCPPWGLPSVACWVRGRLRPGAGGRQPGGRERLLGLQLAHLDNPARDPRASGGRAGWGEALQPRNLGPAQRGKIGEPDEPVVSGNGGGKAACWGEKVILNAVQSGESVKSQQAPAPVPASKVSAQGFGLPAHGTRRKGSGICFEVRNLTEPSDR